MRGKKAFISFLEQFVSVLSFTVVQAIKGKKYVRLTVGIMFLLIGVTGFGSVFLAYNGHKNKEENKSAIEKVWIEEGIVDKDFLTQNKKKNQAFQTITVELVSNLESIPADKIGEHDLLVQVQEKKGSYDMNGVLKEGSRISEEEAKEFVELVKEAYRSTLIKQKGISQKQIEILEKKQTGEVYVAGDSRHGIQWIIMVSVPGLVGILIYLLMVMYGQNIMLEVSSEKTSKLMEMMLVNVYPEALVSGKILGTAILAIVQVLLWIGGVIYGLVAGVLLGSMLFPQGSESYDTVIETTKNSGVPMNLTSGLLMGILIIGLGILLYCFMAGIPGSLITKPEHAGNVQQLVQIPLMICFILTYVAIITEKKELLAVLRYIPFTAPFVLPGELLVGTSSIASGWIISGILVFAIICLGIFSVKIYKYRALKV